VGQPSPAGRQPRLVREPALRRLQHVQLRLGRRAGPRRRRRRQPTVERPPVTVTPQRAARREAVLGWVDRLGLYVDVSLHRSARITPASWSTDSTTGSFRHRTLRPGTSTRGDPRPPRRPRFVFDAESVAHIDSTGMEAFGSLAQDLRGDSITLVLARLRKRLQRNSTPPASRPRSEPSTSTRRSNRPLRPRWRRAAEAKVGRQP